MKNDKVSPVDYKWVLPDPDPNFDPDRARETIERTIKETDKLYRARKRAYSEKVGERTEALAKYFSNLERGRGESDVGKYFGSKMKAHLAGQSIVDRMKNAMQTIGPNGKIVRRPGE